ncbi:MAG: hypothetical protein CMN28_03915 [Salinisphaeraceae bacterium]|nr:hypothetical protein [Salinisphaeraceae bacterium]
MPDAVVTVRCEACRHDNPGDARFCNQCGVSLGGGAPRPAQMVYTPAHLRNHLRQRTAVTQGEHKQVTVLFADVVGSTRLAERAGAEHWHAILDGLFRILTAEVHRAGGTVNQYTGDGIMALFGAPLALEEHARRAAAAALAIRDAVRRYAEDLQPQSGLTLSLRIGLNSGGVVVGAIGDDLRMDYTAQGHTVNLAARMEAMAEPGSVYLTDHTAAWLDGYFLMRELGPMRLEGVAQPQAVFELTGQHALSDRLQWAERRGLSPFTGRDHELEQLADHLSCLRQGRRGRLVVLEGEAGIGKSRLCRRFTELARRDGARTIHVTCPPFEQALAYGPVQQLVRGFFDIDRDDPPARARRKITDALSSEGHTQPGVAPLLHEFLGLQAADSDAPSVAPEDRMARLLALCSQVLVHRHAAAVIVVDDLQWADAQSGMFFRHLSERGLQAPLLLIYNHRPDATLVWASRAADDVIRLSALGDDDCRQLATRLLGPAPALQALGERIVKRAAGNPLYVEECIRDLESRGLLAGPIGARDLRDGDVPDTLPPSIQALLAARIDRLDPAPRGVLYVASVLGMEPDSRMLSALAPETEHCLAALLDGGFLQRARPGRLQFVHPLLREVAYDGQLESARRALHLQAAVWLEETIADRQLMADEAAQIARHNGLAGRPEIAAAWSIEAGLLAGQQDLRVSLECYRRAREWADAAAHAASATAHRIRARAGINRVAALIGVEPDEVDQAWQVAEALCADHARPNEYAELLLSRASVLLNRGHTDQALMRVRQAIATATGPEGRALLGRFRLPLLNVFFVAGALQSGLDALEQLSPEAWSRGPLTQENFLSRALRAMFLAARGDLRTARRDMADALTVARREEQRSSWIHSNRVDLAYLARDPDGAADDARVAIEEAEAFGSPLFLALAWRAQASACYLRGDFEQALDALDRGDAYATPGRQGHPFAPLLQALRAAVLLKAGRKDSALMHARQAVEQADAMAADLWALRARLVLADCLLATETDAAQLITLQKSITTLLTRTGARFFIAPMHLLRAEYHMQAGDRAAARTAFAQAASLFEQFGAPARARLALEQAEKLDTA